MMWNYLAGGLLAGATIVLYDGSATWPGPDRLWRLAAEHQVTYLGVGAPYLVSGMKAGLRPGHQADLSALRGLGSTGSPLPPEAFGWVYDQVSRDLLLGSFSGGTDLCTGFVGPCPLLPVRAGIIAGRCLGAAVAAYDEAGQPVTGQVGELVLTAPMPSMPVGFWGDPGGTRYRESYFEAYPGTWRHGDWLELLPDGGCVIYGRSDATLNRGGVRMGTSEFYRVVEGFDEISDSLVVDTGQLGAEGRLILFVVPAAGALDDDLAARLRAALRAQLSPRHVPDEIRQVPGIPRTLSGKKLEVPVRKILLGTDPARAADPNALANPDVLAYFAPSSPGPGAQRLRYETTSSRTSGGPGRDTTGPDHEGADDAGQQRRRSQGSHAQQGGSGLGGRPRPGRRGAAPGLLGLAGARRWSGRPGFPGPDPVLPARLLSPGRHRGPALAVAAGRDGRGARPARPAPAAGPGRGPGPPGRARPPRPWYPLQPGRGHRHRRHAVSGRLGHHPAQPAPGRDPAAGPPAAAGPPRRGREPARDRRAVLG
jgi:hypothetical protein